DSSPSQYLGATVAGYTLLSETVWNTQTSNVSISKKLGEIKKNGTSYALAVTGQYSWTGFSVCFDATVSKDFTLVVVPMTISGTVSTCPYITVGRASSSTSQPYALNYEVT